MGITLIVNPGSTSKKYALYTDGTLTHSWRFEKTGDGFEVCTRVSDGQSTCNAVDRTTFDGALAQVREELAAAALAPTAVGIRVVSPGRFFQCHRIIDEAFLLALRHNESAAPLHIPITLREIEQVRSHFTGVPLVAVSDSAFHATLPPVATQYSVAPSVVDDADFQRYGYHGLSVASVMRRVHAVVGQDPVRCVVLHAGGGVSVTAVRAGKSVETSMGFAPGSGLLMGTRAGDVDAGALLYLLQKKGWKSFDAEVVLQQQGGLYGLAGVGDVRHLLDRAARGDTAAQHAIDAFVYHINRAIAAAAVPLGGIDTILLTATIMERSSALRARIVSGLAPVFGCMLGEERNDALIARDGVITQHNSKVKVAVVRTDEMGEMRVCTEQVINGTAP